MMLSDGVTKQTQQRFHIRLGSRVVLESHLCSQSLLRYEPGSNRASHTTAECWTSCSRVRQASPGRQLDEGLQQHLCLCYCILSSKPFWFQQDLSFLKSPWLDLAIIALMCRCVKKRWKGKCETGTRKNERMGKQWRCCLLSLPSFPFKDTYLFAVVLLRHCLWSAGMLKAAGAAELHIEISFCPCSVTFSLRVWREGQRWS